MKPLPVVQTPTPGAPAEAARVEIAGMTSDPEKTAALKPLIIAALSKVFDPEIPVNIYDLGNRIAQDRDLQPRRQRVEHGLLDAVVGRQSAHIEMVDLSRPQVVEQGFAIIRVTFQRGIPRLVGVLSLADDDRRVRQLKVR